MQAEIQVKRQEGILQNKKIKKKKDKNEEVKYQDDKSTISNDKKSRGRPKKNPYLSSQIGQQQSQNVSIKQRKKKEKLKQIKIQQKQFLNKKKSSSKFTVKKHSNESDLCKALLLMKNTLPNRSLQKIIIKLYQSISPHQLTSVISENSKKDMMSQQKSLNYQSNYTDKTVSKNDTKSDNHSIKSNQNKNINKIDQSIEKLVVPGKKLSCYHDMPGKIAAVSHQFYKNNELNLQNLQNISKSLNSNQIMIKPLIQQTMINQGTQSNIHKRQISSSQNKIHSFKQSQTLKKIFYNPIQQQKYKQRRYLAQLFIQRGYGMTKSIDQDLPPIDIDRNRYKNLLGGILTMSFRKLESFITNQCKKSIKYIDKQQMKSLSGMLLNCRVKLQSSSCQIYFKFLRIVFGLGDVNISQKEAIQLYVDVLRHLYGKDITLQDLQNIGKIQNRRNMESAIQELKKKAQMQRKKALIMKNELTAGSQCISQNLNIQQKEQYIWTAALQAQFIDLYIKKQNLDIIQDILGEKYGQLDNYTINQYQKKLKELIFLGLNKIKKDSVNQKFDLKSSDLQKQTQKLIQISIQNITVHEVILNYLTGTSQSLQNIISYINDFLDQKALQNIINDINIDFTELSNGNQSVQDNQDQLMILNKEIEMSGILYQEQNDQKELQLQFD